MLENIKKAHKKKVNKEKPQSYDFSALHLLHDPQVWSILLPTYPQEKIREEFIQWCLFLLPWDKIKLLKKKRFFIFIWKVFFSIFISKLFARLGNIFALLANIFVRLANIFARLANIFAPLDKMYLLFRE